LTKALTKDNPSDAVPGQFVQDELELMVEATMSPESALRAATINPAIYLARSSGPASLSLQSAQCAAQQLLAKRGE